MPGPEHQQVTAPGQLGKLHGRLPGDHLLLRGHVAGRLANGLALAGLILGWAAVILAILLILGMAMCAGMHGAKGAVPG